MTSPKMQDLTIDLDGDTWRIISQGALRDGKVYCHLASATRFRQQRNGRCPVQCCDWIDQDLILSAAIQREESARAAIAAYYADRNNGCHAACAPNGGAA